MMYGRECQRPNEWWVRDFNESTDEQRLGNVCKELVCCTIDNMENSWRTASREVDGRYG
jgi:hypothetical protein